MKLINLINKCVERDDTLPNKIKFNRKIYTLAKNNDPYPYYYIGLMDDIEYFSDFNEEIELIEEDKEIEEIKSHYVLGLGESLEQVIEWQKENNKIYEDKINELVKVVNSIKKGN